MISYTNCAHTQWRVRTVIKRWVHIKCSVSWNIYLIKTKWHSSLNYVGNWFNSPIYCANIVTISMIKLYLLERDLRRLSHPGQKIENKAKCLLEIKPRTSFEIHWKSNHFQCLFTFWYEMGVKLEILKRFKKGSKTKTRLLVRLPDERVLNKHLIMWILVQAKLNLKGLPVLII